MEYFCILFHYIPLHYISYILQLNFRWVLIKYKTKNTAFYDWQYVSSASEKVLM